jgi:hypothetical protein
MVEYVRVASSSMFERPLYETKGDLAGHTIISTVSVMNMMLAQSWVPSGDSPATLLSVC